MTLESLPPIAFNVAQLLRESVGASRQYTIEVAAPVERGVVELVRLNQQVLVRADVTVTERFECSRCLRPVAKAVHVVFDEVFEQDFDVTTGARREDPDAEPGAFHIGGDHVIDITEAVRQYSEMAAPMQPLCSEDCPGLCPDCGVDRRNGECSCPEGPSDPRWAALGALRAE